jgi:hypothetical protein
MQIKHYTILEGADMTMIRAWTANPAHGCYLIAQGAAGSEIYNLCVYQPLHSLDRITATESHLAGMIQETAWPE